MLQSEVVENQNGRPKELEDLLEKRKSVFKEGLGKFKDVKVNIQLKEHAKPRFCKSRLVPYALRERIERELDRLVKEGIYEPVQHSNWAAPIVPVEKGDGGLRICGDYKMTINPRAECDKFPVPRTEDLLATLSGGKARSKNRLAAADRLRVIPTRIDNYCTHSHQIFCSLDQMVPTMAGTKLPSFSIS